LARVTELLLGIDVGTSSSKGCLAEPDGRIVRTAEVMHTTSMPRPGWFEHDPLGVWWHDLLVLCSELLIPEQRRPVAVCVSGIGPCLLPATANGEPLRPAILYGIDIRATAEIEELNGQFGSQRILERAGSPLTSQAIGPKLLWLRHHEPDVYARTRRFFMASSYLVHSLTAEYVLDHHSASQCDPLYDLAATAWAGDWVSEVAPELEFPRLLWPAEVAGHVTPAASARTGIPAGTPVMAGTIDAWAEAFSVGVEQPGQLMLMYGTTMFLVRVVDSASPDRRLWLTTGVVPGTLTIAAGMATSGALTAWFRDLTGATYADLLAAAEAAPRGSDGLVVLPYFAGERTPLFDPQARGLVLGLTLRHGRGHLYRALLEATGYAVRHNLETIAERAGPPVRIAAVGGGTRGGLWTQIVSDVCGIEQDIHTHSIGASYGDARLAGIGCGFTSPATSWNPVAERVVPDRSAREVYDAFYAIYRDLYQDTVGLAHRLADLQQPTG